MRVYNKTLDTNLWNEDNTLKPEIRSALLKIASDFFKSTDLTIPILNILFLGSSANYNWTPESDLDLHVVIDVTQLNIDQTLTRSFMDGLAAKWNNNHEIEIKGHPVEVYLQDIRERNSTAELAREGASIYSVLSNQWLKQPNHQKPVIDKEKILQKYKSIKAKISDFVSSKDIDKLKALMKAIRKYRDAGLTRAGEFGTENLVFKALRTSGDLTKLKDAINSIYDKSVTVNELKKKVVRESKFNPFDAKSLQFVTYGGLGLNKQRGYDKDSDNFHKPPARHGIYAFVWPYIEKFLLGGNDLVNPKKRGKGQRNRVQFVKDKDGNLITSKHPEFPKHADISKNWTMPHNDDAENPEWKLYQNSSRKKFSYAGPLWHHLEVPEFAVLARNGHWVKTDMDTYKKALKKELHSMLRGDDSWRGAFQSSFKFSSKDHLEVFIDEKI
jgi:predicted nucleotidyltransferase